MPLHLVDRVILCEVGPRDGLQNEKRILTTEEKLELIEGAAEAGFSVIEAGSFFSPKAVPQMADTDEVFRRLRPRTGVEYRALAGNLKGVERAAACGCKKLKLNVSASRAHNLANLNRTPAETVAGFAPCSQAARAAGMEISGSISMAFGSPWDREISQSDVKEIVDAYLSVGIREISLSDTSGQANPVQVFRLCTEMARTYPQVTWWLHFHRIPGGWVLPIFWRECRQALPDTTPRLREWAGVPSFTAPPAMCQPRMWCICVRSPAWRQGSIWTGRWSWAAGWSSWQGIRPIAACFRRERQAI